MLVEPTQLESPIAPVDGVLAPETLEQLRLRARSSLFLFAKGVLGYDWLNIRIHRPLCRLLELYDGWKPEFGHRDEYVSVLQDVIRRLKSKQKQLDNDKSSRKVWDWDTDDDKWIEDKLTRGIKRLRIVLPRGWLKSTLCSIAYPTWRALRDVNMRTILVQNTHNNACAKLGSIRDQFDGNILFKALFPELQPNKRVDTWKSEALQIPRTGRFPEATFEAAGTRTQVTGRHYNLIIEDDTVAPDLDEMGVEALVPSKEDVDKAIGWHRLSPPLTTNPETDQILVVGTRWFEYDLMSWIEDNELQYVVYERSCRETDGLSDPKGEVTYQERFSEKVLDELLVSMGPYSFSCLYFNKPVRSGDMTFKPEWIDYYDIVPANMICYTTVDLATDPEESKSQDLDYTVVITCGKCLTTGRIYVLDYWRQRHNPGAMVDAIFDHVRRYHPVRVGYESVAYQKSASYWIKQRMRLEGLYFAVEGLTNTKRSKGARISDLQPVFSSRSILLRTHMKDLVGELLSFPLGAHDDIIDALSMQLQLWRVTKTRTQEREKEVSLDPLSFDSALKEIQARSSDKRLRLASRDLLCRTHSGALEF